MPKPKVFISATSRDLKSYREVVTAWAEQRGYEPVVQDYFSVQSDYGTVMQMLRDKLAPCDAVIHLAGLFYGFEPTNRPSGEIRRSYTQLEYELGKELRRQVFRFISREDYKPDNEFTQTAEQAELQQLHRRRLMKGNEAWSATSRTTGNELYYEFSNHAELRKLLEHIEIKATLAQPQNLPLVGALFKGRDEFIEQLRSVLVNKPTHIAAVTAKQAIHGLGGVGKTRVAVEYAKRYSHEYTALLFITADSPANLQRNLANLCGALVLNLPEKEASEQEVQVAAALRWLREHAGWFLIVDNVDTPDAAKAVESLLQQLDSGHIVVTSRLSQWGDAVQELALDVISESSAQEFLLERTNGKRKTTATDDADALALAGALGRLPLALEQAGAFIVKHRTSFKAYLDRWRQQEAKVLEWHDQRTMKYPASVATTWQTSFDQLTEDGRGLLNVLCWLAPDPIPLSMIEKLSTIDDEQPIDIETGIADLAEYSLLKWSNDQYESVEIHRLVEEITRYRLSEPDSIFWLQRALRMVNNFVSAGPAGHDVRSWTTIYTPGQSHIAAVVQFADQRSGSALEASSVPDNFSTLSALLMSCLAGYLYTRASHHEAEQLMRRALEIDEKFYGAEHPGVARSLNNLAQLLQAKSRLAEAEPLMRRVVAIIEKAYGENHRYVATPLNNLAQLLQDTNRLVEAEQLMRRALAIDEQSYGAQHPDVARDLNNLARLFQDTNRLTEAEPLMRRALDIDEQFYGVQHPAVGRDLNSLATLLQATNRLAEAEPLMRRALAIDEQSYGAEHPNVAIRLNNFSQLLQVTNRVADAELLIRRAQSINEQCYGAEHPNVAINLNNLGQLLKATNRLKEAEPLMVRVVMILEKSYGENHPNVATALNNLSQLLQDTNREAEAEPFIRRALAIDEQSYGADHPTVARDLNNLAQLLQDTNRLAEAEPLMRRVVTIFEKSYGENHPNVAIALNNLAGLLKTTNRRADAETLMARVVTIFEKSYGENHPNVATALNNLSQLLQDTNRLAEAETLMRRALAIDEQSYGAEHPKVAIRLSNLATLLKATNRLAEAEPLMRRALAIDEQSYGDQHPNVARDLNNLAQLLKATNRLAEAEPLAWRNVTIFIRVSKSTGHEHPHMQTALRNYKGILIALGHSEDEADDKIQSKLQEPMY